MGCHHFTAHRLAPIFALTDGWIVFSFSYHHLPTRLSQRQEAEADWQSRPVSCHPHTLLEERAVVRRHMRRCLARVNGIGRVVGRHCRTWSLLMI